MGLCIKVRGQVSEAPVGSTVAFDAKEAARRGHPLAGTKRGIGLLGILFEASYGVAFDLPPTTWGEWVVNLGPNAVIVGYDGLKVGDECYASEQGGDHPFRLVKYKVTGVEKAHDIWRVLLTFTNSQGELDTARMWSDCYPKRRFAVTNREPVKPRELPPGAKVVGLTRLKVGDVFRVAKEPGAAFDPTEYKVDRIRGNYSDSKYVVVECAGRSFYEAPNCPDALCEFLVLPPKPVEKPKPYTIDDLKPGDTFVFADEGYPGGDREVAKVNVVLDSLGFPGVRWKVLYGDDHCSTAHATCEVRKVEVLAPEVPRRNAVPGVRLCEVPTIAWFTHPDHPKRRFKIDEHPETLTPRVEFDHVLGKWCVLCGADMSADSKRPRFFVLLPLDEIVKVVQD